MMAKFPLLTEAEAHDIVTALNANNGELWKPGVSASKAWSDNVKRNLEQPVEANETAAAVGRFITDRLLKTEFFTRRTLPKHISRPRFNLYQDGGEYGRHADSAFMGQNPETRTDMSMTLWLTEPELYDGGELVLEYTSGAVVALKEPVGMLAFYPSGVMHYVKPVTSGQRIAFVAWVESHIQDPQKRDILVEISNLCDDFEANPDLNLGELHIKATNIKHNLYRQWMWKA